MGRVLRDPVTVVWVLLVAASLISWWLGTGHGMGQPSASAVIVTVAFIKVHLVGRYFMALRDAPRPLRMIFDAYCVAVCAGLVVMLYAM